MRKTEHRVRGPLLLGPAFVAAVAYVDPGNVAANLTAGATLGYLLVWVLVLAGLMAAVVQYLSAKLGLVTGRTLPELMRDRLPGWARLPYWAQAELIAAATDVAEVIGGALALYLLFGLPLPVGGLIIGIASMGLLVLQTRRRQRIFEAVIITLLGVIVVGFLAGLFVSPPDWGQVAGGLVPRFAGSESVLLAASMLGATVMPHVIYLHSALTRDRHGVELSKPRILEILRATRWDVGLSLTVAGGVNVAMLLLAAGSLRGVGGTDTITGAHAAIVSHLGATVGVIFAIGLLASGLASTAVGAYAGSAIMGGLLHRRVPVVVRRLVTLVPALIILLLGADPTWTLVISQVILSFGIPFAVIPLLLLTSDRELMGQFVNRLATKLIGIVISVVICTLNVVLIVLTVTGTG
ncbi:Nramp family divalent metal transporter [Naumannella halotolerans]|uniref:Manganese transport protein n=1 Tax=Naumannella halotolerans TaxID=993414 RepID=A0A4R7J959_9ACTN|nr:manganese transport protein [Naumannella halotolerans]